MIGGAEPFDGGDLLADHIDGQDRAAVNGFAFQQHGTRPASTGIAYQFRAGQWGIESVANRAQQRGARLNGDCSLFAVDS